MGIFRRQEQQPETAQVYVVPNPNANSIVIKQLSTRFKDFRGRNAWDYIRQNPLALFEILDGANGYGLVSPKEYKKALLALDARFMDSDGTSALDYLKSHMGLAQDLFIPTQAYTDRMVKKLSGMIILIRRDEPTAQHPLDA